MCTERELDKGPAGRVLLGRRIVIYRDQQAAVIAAPDRCPHREAPLSAGTVDHGVLTCCYHGWSFGADGKCVGIPSASPGFPIPDNAHLPVISTAVCYGLVWICLGENPPPIPVIDKESDQSYRRINNPVESWKVSAMRMTDNFLDIAHFPWVHIGTFGNSQRTGVADIKLEMLEGGFYGYRYDVTADNPVGANLSSGQTGDTVSRSMSTGFYLPFTVRSTIEYESGLNHIILLLSTPVDDVTSYFTFVVWRNDDFSIASEEMIAFDRMIGAEDKAMLEKIPGVLPMTIRSLANTQSDKASSAWRHQFIQLLDGKLPGVTTS